MSKDSYFALATVAFNFKLGVFNLFSLEGPQLAAVE